MTDDKCEVEFKEELKTKRTYKLDLIRIVITKIESSTSNSFSEDVDLFITIPYQRVERNIENIDFFVLKQLKELIDQVLILEDKGGVV